MKAHIGLGWVIIGICLMLLPIVIEPQSFFAVVVIELAGSLMLFRYMCQHDWMS